MVEIPLTKGLVAIVDDCNASLAKKKWYARGHPDRPYAAYARPRRNGRWDGLVFMHRLVLGLVDDRSRFVREVDHINGNTLDNRLANLRLATSAQNKHNARKRHDNTTGFKGVCWHKGAKKWMASIALNGKQKYLGLYPSAELAAKAYDKAAVDLFGGFAAVNFKEVA